ncbi:putative RNA-binding protein (RRM superfamily) [Heracleum sosnowskyi]|uniref:RNA-binding protein (RRM superfamily) n=1 Tax=Heracleum sosnowskyi TaxID=360622 RepID=A0AAD8NA71_9APIA|nr:putative RNA-binding protein (RRM superfamily) [Heracleum sosnowskyi]
MKIKKATAHKQFHLIDGNIEASQVVLLCVSSVKNDNIELWVHYKLFLSFFTGLSKRTTTEGLHVAFAKFGEIVHARVVTDRNSGYSKGFGFVRYATVEDAEAGIKGMDGQFLDGWVIFAEYARPRPVPGQSDNTFARRQ